MKLHLLTVLCLALILSGCEKKNNCSTKIQLTASTKTPTVGETFTITASPDLENDLFYWSGPGNLSGNYGNTLNISNPGYLDRGWYHCSKSNTDCGESVFDSIYIDVKLRQGTAPCSQANNSLTGSGIPATNFYSVTKIFDPSYHGKALFGDAPFGYPNDFRVLFNTNNGNVEPVDGIYTTTNSIGFSQTDPYIWVSLSFVYNSQFFHCHPDKNVFVSHINGKLSASFCNVPFSNGTTIINLSGKLTEN